MEQQVKLRAAGISWRTVISLIVTSAIVAGLFVVLLAAQSTHSVLKAAHFRNFRSMPKDLLAPFEQGENFSTPFSGASGPTWCSKTRVDGLAGYRWRRVTGCI